ncbi:MFS transporter [Tundrisphaera sp. TA3]|uniref:MFS transporter n=1 Tax=Tundrisphaera sp. TA3 TaxID=3435775 RepID=UPI003EB8899C
MRGSGPPDPLPRPTRSSMPDLTAPPRARTATFAALAIPDYRRFYIGQGISLIGTWLQDAAVGWIVYEVTRSEMALGQVQAASLLPGLAVGLFAGALADRVAPKALILSTQIGQMALAFALAALVAFGVERVSIAPLAVVVALARVLITFEMPARQVFLYGIVGRASLMNAIALNNGLFNASRVIGPALAGLCFETLGGAWCFGLNGASYLAAIAALLSIRARERPQAAHAEGDAGNLLGGIAYLGRDRRVRGLFTLMAVFGVCGMGYSALMPAYARVVVGTGARGYSVLLAAAGVGATCGALVVASLGGLARKERLIPAGLLVFSAFLAASSALPKSPGGHGGEVIRLAIGAFCMMGAGFGGVMFYSSTQTLIQTSIPDELRGRIMGIWMIIFSASVPLGALWSGGLAAQVGVEPVLRLAALLSAVAAAVAIATGFLAQRRDDPVSHLPPPT